MGNGLQIMLLPIRGGIEGFSALDIGYLGSGYYVGFVIGCVLTPQLIYLVGHIRTFAALVAVASAAALGYPLGIDIWIWVALRMISGICLAGLYLVVESWLNDMATNKTRGTLMSVYVAVNFTVITVGQMLVTVFQPDSFVLFSIASILVSVAALPIVMTRSAQPAPITFVRFRPLDMLRLSPTGTIAVFLIGLATGAFWSLAPAYANELSGSVTVAALFVAIAVLGGAVAQWPAGILSDFIDRRIVLIGISLASVVIGLVITVLPRLDGPWLAFAFAFGATLLPTYAIAASHVYDFADRSQYVEFSAGLLLLNGLGSAIGPILAAIGVATLGQAALFYAHAIFYLSLIAFVGVRLWKREGLPQAKKESFDYATTAAVSIVGDAEAIEESDLVVQDPEPEDVPPII